MKKVIFGLAVVAAAALGVYNANKGNVKAQMSDLQMENIEALGQDGEPNNGRGTLWGNAKGTLFCCRSGSSSCNAAPCPW